MSATPSGATLASRREHCFVVSARRHEKEEVFNQIDKLEEDRNKKLEDILLDVLPQAFAVVKETARRFKENEKLVVVADMRDKQLAAKHEHITIEGDNAVWHNEWIAAGNKIKWDMLHYDVQLIGGVVLHQGKIAEMGIDLATVYTLDGLLGDRAVMDKIGNGANF